MTFQVKANPTFDIGLTIVGQGRKQKLNLVFRHRTQDERDTLWARLEKGEIDLIDVILDITESWDADVSLDRAGLKELRQQQPGADDAILQGYGNAIRVEREKN